MATAKIPGLRSWKKYALKGGRSAWKLTRGGAEFHIFPEPNKPSQGPITSYYLTDGERIIARGFKTKTDAVRAARRHMKTTYGKASRGVSGVQEFKGEIAEVYHAALQRVGGDKERAEAMTRAWLRGQADREAIESRIVSGARSNPDLIAQESAPVRTTRVTFRNWQTMEKARDAMGDLENMPSYSSGPGMGRGEADLDLFGGRTDAKVRAALALFKRRGYRHSVKSLARRPNAEARNPLTQREARKIREESLRLRRRGLDLHNAAGTQPGDAMADLHMGEHYALERVVGEYGPRQNPDLIEQIRLGDRVTIVDRFGKKRTGRAVMRSDPQYGPGWVLNMGGPHGTPGLATPENIVRVRPGRRRGWTPLERGYGRNPTVVSAETAVENPLTERESEVLLREAEGHKQRASIHGASALDFSERSLHTQSAVEEHLAGWEGGVASGIRRTVRRYGKPPKKKNPVKIDVGGKRAEFVRYRIRDPKQFQVGQIRTVRPTHAYAPDLRAAKKKAKLTRLPRGSWVRVGKLKRGVKGPLGKTGKPRAWAIQSILVPKPGAAAAAVRRGVAKRAANPKKARRGKRGITTPPTERVAFTVAVRKGAKDKATIAYPKSVFRTRDAALRSIQTELRARFGSLRKAPAITKAEWKWDAKTRVTGRWHFAA